MPSKRHPVIAAPLSLSKGLTIVAIPHAKPGEPFDIRPHGEAIAGAVTRALIKTDRLEVIRMVVPADKAIPLHTVKGEMTVQCLEGLVAFTAGSTTHELAAGQMLYLSAREPHSLRGIETAYLLITILLHE